MNVVLVVLAQRESCQALRALTHLNSKIEPLQLGPNQGILAAGKCVICILFI